MKKLDPKLKKYWYLGITLFLAASATLVVWTLLNIGALNGAGFLSSVNSALTPVYIGLIIAYLLSPLVDRMERFLFEPLMKKIVKKNEKMARGAARGISVTIVLLLALLVIFGLLMLVVPEVIESISSLVSNLPGYYRNIIVWGDEKFQANPQYAEYFERLSSTVYEKLLTWLRDDLLPNSNKLLTVITDSIMNAVNVVVNVFIGLIVSIYLMAGKENFCAQAKKILYAVFSVKHADALLDVLREVHTVFAKFIVGRIIDSLLVGVLTFIIMSIANIPYTVLVSVIIGVTNLIPFFGQYLGIIPSAILVFIANPFKGVIFLILIIILMQFDGNVMGPKILGDSIGLGSFWILFSILFFGSLFGLVGMVCAVPVFAVFYRMVSRWCARRLTKKDIPADTDYYRNKKPLSAVEKDSETER